MNSTSRRFLVALVAFGLVTGAVAADKVRIADHDKIQKDWVPAANSPLMQAPYPQSVTDRSRDICVSLGYQINRDGTTSDFGVLRVWSSENPDVYGSADALQPFTQSAAAAVSTWKYEATPTAASNRVVYTSASVPFVGSRGTPVEQVRARCEITDLREFIAQAQQKAFRRGDANKAAIDRYQRNNAPRAQTNITGH
jgi:hypothetical protein